MFSLSILIFIILKLQFAFSTQISIMYPYGSGLCDKSVPKNDDGSEGPFDLGPFYINSIYKYEWVHFIFVSK